MTTEPGAVTSKECKPHFYGALAVLVLGVSLITACIAGSGGPDLTIVNGRSVAINVYWIDPQGKEDLTTHLHPGEDFTYPILRFQGMIRYTARDNDGQFIATRCYTWEELRAADWTFVFGAADPASGSRGSCEREA